MNIDIILNSLIPNLNVDLLEYWKSRACTEITNYLNKEIDNDVILEKYKDAVIELVVEYNNRFKIGDGVTSMTQGQRSVSYATEVGVSDKVKKLLPKPYLKVGAYSVL